MILAASKPVNMYTREFIKSLGFSYGHFGTLDYFAEGLLLFGSSSRLAPYIHLLPKTYEGEGILGRETDTQDTTGRLLQTDTSVFFSSLAHVTKQEIEEKVKHTFQPSYFQNIPYFSATKHLGKPLYEYARQNIFIKKAPVERTIFHFTVNKIIFPKIFFTVKVSSGTYIRQFFVDLAKEFSTIGTLDTLKRTHIGNIQNPSETVLLSPFDLLDYPVEDISTELWNKTFQGKRDHLKNGYYFFQHNQDLAFVDGFLKKVLPIVKNPS